MKLSVQTAAVLPAGHVLKCHVVRGLELHANAQSKTWKFYYRLHGQQRRPALGLYPETGIEQAREMAKEWRQRVNRGEDPSQEKQEARQALTVAQMADLYLAECRAEVQTGQRKPRTYEENERHVRRHIKPRIGSMKVAAVELVDVNRFHDKVAAKAPVYANRVRDTLSAIFALAERSDVKARPADSNPVRKSKTSRERKRRRHASGPEFAAMSRELAALAVKWPARVAALITIAYCGSRVTEIITAKKHQRIGNKIILAEHKTDADGDDRIIYLPRQARDALAALPGDGSDYIFGAGLSRYNVYTVWDKARDAAAAEVPSVVTLSVLDMRRSFASAAKSRGIGLEVVGDLFGHKDRDTTDRYSWLFDEVAEDATQRTADAIEELMRGGTAPIAGDHWSG